MSAVEILGKDTGKGNLLGIQPVMAVDDYRGADSFYRKLAAYLDEARANGLVGGKTVVVFPEYLATWLVVAGEPEGVYRSAALQGGMQVLVLSNLARFAAQFFGAKEKARIEASLFRLKARKMAEIYSSVFSRLAQAYGVTIVGGSILLPEPAVVDGKVAAGRGALQNVSAVFRPDGGVEPALVRKIYPIAAELPMLSGAALEDLRVYATPAGRLGVLICADSWYPEPYARLQAQGVEILAVPSYINHAGAWEQPWLGYNGRAAPADCDPADVGRLQEGQAWKKYALVGRTAACGAKAGVNVFLQGQLWDMGADGRSVLVGGQTVLEAKTTADTLMNVWLE